VVRVQRKEVNREDRKNDGDGERTIEKDREKEEKRVTSSGGDG